MSTGIQWTDETWNPVTGCTKVSPGCDHCYAERITERFHGRGSFATVTLHPERLDKPLHWRKPRRVFVNSMSDLFHKDVPDGFIARVFAVMAATPQHTYQVLTKRHGRMRSLLRSAEMGELFGQALQELVDHRGVRLNVQYPLPNVWLGVSVEDQKRADLRIPALLETPAAVRFLSCEPLLGIVDLDSCAGVSALAPDWIGGPSGGSGAPHPLIDWVICGGETGPAARPMHPVWARSLRDQCSAAGVPFFFKHWGEWARTTAKPHPKDRATLAVHPAGMTALRPDNPFDPFERGHPHWVAMRRVGTKTAGRLLDGRTHDAYPITDKEVTST